MKLIEFDDVPMNNCDVPVFQFAVKLPNRYHRVESDRISPERPKWGKTRSRYAAGPHVMLRATLIIQSGAPNDSQYDKYDLELQQLWFMRLVSSCLQV